MLKIENKFLDMVLLRYILLFTTLLLVHISCAKREEEDATQIIEKAFQEKHDSRSTQEKFVQAIEVIRKGSSTDDLDAHTNVAKKILTENSQDLDNRKNSITNPLHLILVAIGSITGEEGVEVVEGSKVERLLEIFKLLRDKGFTLQEGTLRSIRDKAITDRQQALYYPLVFLKEFKPTTEVKYTDKVQTSILSWALLKNNLNKAVRKEMVQILAGSHTKEAAEAINNLYATGESWGKLTPPMLALKKAEGRSQDADVQDFVDFVTIFLQNPAIKFNGEKATDLTAPVSLKDQPLLGFIIYNCIQDEIKLQDQWLTILDTALMSGDLESKSKAAKEFVKNYLENYIGKTKKNNALKEPKKENFTTKESSHYPQGAIKKVRQKLENYLK